ncbi:MAG: energy transducer TonB [Sphingomonadales bacterium]|nr:energy transducer TonB [Sphingomonadales bacterium]
MTMHFARQLLALTLFMMPATASAQSVSEPRTGSSADAGLKSQAVSTEGYISDNDYPPEAIRNYAEGTVVVKFTISTNGRVPVCEIAESSGSDVLDDTSCKLIRDRFRYTPAKGSDGKAIPETRTQRIKWRLPGGDERLEEMTPSTLEIELIVAPDGSVKACKVVKALGYSPNVSVSACSYMMAHRKFKPFEGTRDKRITYHDTIDVADVE